ncbi:MAG: 50S ribosomal protein L24 [Spirosomataceae bacterium]|jgi:large subunit ribosomal protein L24|nr:50S ribosomal protein L24 [Bacteroidota bacterium]
MERKFNKQPKLHVKSGDTVEVIAGNNKGKRGKIVEVLVKKSRVKIEGIGMIKKHIKPSAQNPQGEIREEEGSIHISNVLVVDPSTGKATRTGRKVNEAGKLQRYSKASGKFI